MNKPDAIPENGLATIPRALLYSNVSHGAMVAYAVLSDCATEYHPGSWTISVEGLASIMCRNPVTIVNYLTQLAPRFVSQSYEKIEDQYVNVFTFIPAPVDVPDTVPEEWKGGG